MDIDANDPIAKFKNKFEMSVDFKKPEWAEIAMRTLDVDKELKPRETCRELSVSGSHLIVKFGSVELRLLRTSVSSFFDMLSLVTKTINEFGEL